MRLLYILTNKKGGEIMIEAISAVSAAVVLVGLWILGILFLGDDSALKTN